MMSGFYYPVEQAFKERAEFARKGIARGRSIAAVRYVDGILLMGANPSGSLHKLGEIYDRLAFAGVGRFNEFETLRVAGIRYADLKGYSYGRIDVTGRGLANAYSQAVGQIFTHENKPYEVEVLVAEVGDDSSEDQLFRVQFDGTLRHETDLAALGGKDEDLQERLVAGWSEGMELDAAIALVVGAIEGVEEQTTAAEDWEAAVLDRKLPRRKFRWLTADEIGTARG
jgi:proteasome alpha subunit